VTLSAVVALVIGLVALLARRTEGSWVAPAPMFAAFWAGIMFVAGITFTHLDLILASLYVLAAVIAMWIGSVIGHAFDPPPGEATPRLQSPPFIRAAILCALVLGVVEIGVEFANTGRSLRDFFSLSAIIETVISNRADRFNGVQQSAGEWVIMLILYTSTFLGGILLRLYKSRRDILLALSAPVMLTTVFALYGSRVSALYGGAFFVGTYLATSALVAEHRQVISTRALVRTAVMTTLLMIGLSVVTQGLRLSKSMPDGWRGAFADGFDYPAAMGIWMDQRSFIGRDFTAGGRGFARIVAVAGISADPLPSIPVDFVASNIYSFFRDAIEDFGTLGSIVFFAVVGCVGRTLFSRALAGRVAILAPLSTLYAFLMTSPAEDIFFYTISVAAIVLFTVYGAILVVVHRRRLGRDAAALPASSP